MKKFTTTEIEFVLGQMKQLEKDHPKAEVIFDSELARVLITYPLPKDYFNLKKFNNAPIDTENICDWCKGLNCHSPKCPNRAEL